MRDLANLLRALSDPSRLRILNVLSHQCLCVCDLQTVLGLSQPLVSRHLASLRHAGLVRDRRGGTWVCYSPVFDGPYGPAVQSFLREILLHTPSLQADLERLRQCGMLGELKYCAVTSEPEEGAGSPELDSGMGLQPAPGQ
jgi:ArsR family transcriptional regulator